MEMQIKIWRIYHLTLIKMITMGLFKRDVGNDVSNLSVINGHIITIEALSEIAQRLFQKLKIELSDDPKNG